MDLQTAWAANHDELAVTFQQVKSAPRHFCDKGVKADFTFDIAYGASDNPAVPGGFAVKDRIAPGRVPIECMRRGRIDNLHVPGLREQGKR